MADPRQIVIVTVPERGAYTWPGREALDERTRILLEARTMDELMIETGKVEVENLESVLGYWEYLQKDWRWLHDAKFRKRNPNYVSLHSAALRAGGHYLRSTKWRGGIPETSFVSDYLKLLSN